MIGLFRSSQEEFLRCDGEQGSALRGGFLSARAERNQRAAKGWAQDGHSRAHIRPPPGPPFYGGRQLGSLGGHRKGAGGQRIGFRSMTAAAEFPVTFGWYPYRLEARLLGWWGSSSAQRDGVSKMLPDLRRGDPCGRPFMCETARPGGRALRRREPHRRRAATWGRPYGGKQTVSVSSANPGAVVKPHQRQFLQTQGPVARNETMKATQILRAENYLPSPRGNPRNGGPGVRRI